MDIFRIRGMLTKNGSLFPSDTFELVAGLTPNRYIAAGPWYGTVRDGHEYNPFVLDQEGRCQYAGGSSEVRHFNIVKRPVSVGEVFELTWEDSQDRHFYKVDSVAQLNVS